MLKIANDLEPCSNPKREVEPHEKGVSTVKNLRRSCKTGEEEISGSLNLNTDDSIDL